MLYQCFSIMIGLIFIISGLLRAQTAPEDLFEPGEYISDERDTLLYRIMKPKEPAPEKKFPLVLFLHGMGERGDDNTSQLEWGVTRFAEESFRAEHPAFVVAPQAPGDDFWADLDWRDEGTKLAKEPTRPLQLADKLVDKIADEYPVDKDRLYITGLSMGGFGTWDLITRRPDKFAAAMPICGGGDPSEAHRLTDLPIWNFHGARDQVVPPELSRDMIDAIREEGGTPGYTEYPHVDHFSWIPAYRDRFALEWLFEQQR